VKLKNGERILVTGGCGFIGSALLRVIKEHYDNIRIRVIDNLSSGITENIEGLGVEFIEGDILDAERCQRAIDSVDTVFHLAALPFIPNSYKDPGAYFRANADGSMGLFVAALKAKVRLVVYVSTCEVYGAAHVFPIDESHPTNPVSVYAASKLAAEKVAYALHKEHNLPLVILRPFNTYGPRDSFPRIIPELITQLHKGTELKLGNLNARRDFTYVEDVAKGMLLAANTGGAVGKIVNLCSGEAVSVQELTALVARSVGVNGYHIGVEKARLRLADVNRFVGDGTVARELLDWRPEFDLAKGMERTIEWYRQAGGWQWER
jgi:nucleoside-diphosphate-sugar epimerase